MKAKGHIVSDVEAWIIKGIAEEQVEGCRKRMFPRMDYVIDRLGKIAELIHPISRSPLQR